MSRIISLDTETHAIPVGNAAPRIVCMTWAERDATGKLHTGLVDHDRALVMFDAWIRDPDVLLVGANIFFDLGCFAAERADWIPLIYQAFEQSRIRCVQVAAKMQDIRDGTLKFSYDDDGEAHKTKHSLADLTWRYLKRNRFGQKKGLSTKEFLRQWPACHFDVTARVKPLPYTQWPAEAKASPWRKRYGMLADVPIQLWPLEATQYATDDAIDAMEVVECLGDPVVDEMNQQRYQWYLSHMGLWGVRTDLPEVQRVEALLRADADAGSAEMIKLGLMKWTRAKNKHTGKYETRPGKDMKAIAARVVAAYQALGKPHPVTDGGAPASDKDTLKDSRDPVLIKLAELNGTLKLLSKDIPQLQAAARRPLIVRWNGLVETGRTSASPNVQNNPRKGGIRECYIPRFGWVYVFVDFDTAELRALAQVCLNLGLDSHLAKILNAGKDPHVALGATLLGVSYEEMEKLYKAGDPDAIDYRQFAKIPNFGLPGGMGPDSLVDWAMNQLADKPALKARMTYDFACELIEGYHATYPEMREYFKWINAQCGKIGEASITQMYSGRERGGVPYCAACNTLFQGLVADAAKSALGAVMTAAWCETASPLYQIVRPNLFIHDEVGSEVWYGDPVKASIAAHAKRDLMVNEAQKWMPDVIVKAKPVMCRRWYKGAEPVYLDGILVPSKPVKENGKTKWVADV